MLFLFITVWREAPEEIAFFDPFQKSQYYYGCFTYCLRFPTFILVLLQKCIHIAVKNTFSKLFRKEF
jgi:hypothetical protein